MDKYTENGTFADDSGNFTVFQGTDKPRSFEDACYELTAELARLVIAKQQDYGHENILAFGELGILVRTNDKVARLKNIIQKTGVSNEPRIDSWKDLAGYAILALMLDRGWFTLELKG